MAILCNDDVVAFDAGGVKATFNADVVNVSTCDAIDVIQCIYNRHTMAFNRFTVKAFWAAEPIWDDVL